MSNVHIADCYGIIESEKILDEVKNAKDLLKDLGYV